MAIALEQGGEPIPVLMFELELSTAQFGPFHRQTIVVANGLAMPFWRDGDSDQAICLDQAPDGVASSCPPDHPVRSDLLCTLAEILVDRGNWEQAASIYREILDGCIRRSGSNHESSLAAKGDLALVWFESGKAKEAGEMEREASDCAGIYLGTTHPVTSIVAWNRALRLEDEGDTDSARAIIVKELLWLLSEDENHLQTDQQTVRAMLAKRWGWDAARVC